MNVFTEEMLGKTSWCRGLDCKYHPSNGKKKIFSNLNKEFEIIRCLSCKKFVQKEMQEK